MLNFKCSNCQNDINVAHQYMGDMIQCPFCVALQIVPDQMLPDGADFNGFTIVKTVAASSLWTSYEVAQQPHNLAMCIPTSFFMKRISDMSGFAEQVAISGSLNSPELPTLLNHGLTPENEFFIFDYQPNAFKINSFISENPLGAYNALLVTRNIAKCLSQIWEQYGILHQCLTPENISVTHDFNVRIKNIGFSEYLLQDQSLLEQGFNVWDYHFMSPEFMNDGVADSPACDIYSLGGILFYLCSGHFPHESIPPESISQTPPPSLRMFVPDCLESLEILIQMMMSPNTEGRLNAWHEVIKHIDTILANQSMSSSQVVYFDAAPNQTDYHNPVGISAGDLTQAIKKEKAMIDTTSGPKVTAPHKTIKPIHKSNLSTMNKKWSKKKGLKPKRKGKRKPAKQHDHEERPTPAPKKDSTTAMVITLSIAALVALIVVTIILVNANKNKKKPRRRTVANTSTQQSHEQEFSSADAKQRELLLKQGIDPSKLNPNAKPTNTLMPPSTTPKVTAPVTRKPKHRPATKTGLKGKLLAIDQFYLNNPAQAGEALRRYEALMTEARQAKNFDAMDLIQEKIDAMPEGTVAATAPTPEIEAVISTIKKQILPLLKEERYDEALKILLEYDGDLAAESKSARIALSVEIKNRIAKIQGTPQGEADTTPAPAASSKNPVDVLKKIAKLIAPQLLKSEVKTAKAQLDMALTTAPAGLVKSTLTSWSTQVANYEKLKPSLDAQNSALPVIEAGENTVMTEKAFLLQGLLYKDKEEFIRAKQAFEKMPNYMGDIFVSAMEKSLTE